MMDKASTRIGWIGCGAIGLPMLARLVSEGWRVMACDRDAARRAEAAALSIATVERPAQLGAEIDTLVLSLPDAAAARGALLESGLPLAGRIILDTTSMAPPEAVALARAVHEAGGLYLDGPVSGGKDAAARGELVAFVGGDTALVERARPLLQSLATRITHCGETGAGQWAKAANQAIVCGTLAVWHEALRLAEAGGLDPLRLVDALQGSGADSRVRGAFGAALARGDYVPSANILKDIAAANALLELRGGTPLLADAEAILTQMATRNT